ncbi:MAG: HipA domain-containing protein [Myxococcaceae bacterium]|nr:HipA domain-containing protein [Myxococcaceae bacterium]
MSSKTGPSSCFVYITLPGQTVPVTAARFELTTTRQGEPLGRLVYGKSYLARQDAVPLEPLELPLLERTFETTQLSGVFGALRDASPDFWGRRIIERHAGKPMLSELDYLLHSPDDRAGALAFGLGATPPPPLRKYNQTLDLQHLQALADAILVDESEAGPAAAQVEALLLVGTSMGGARPKTVVEDGEGLWLAKFNRPDDKWNSARVEHAMLVLASECGVQAAASRIVSVAGRDVLLVKRFDRQKTEAGYLRARMVSALTLLRADETPSLRGRWSYLEFVEALRRASGSAQRDAHELFRRACFNALISNTDDHPRNHALVAMGREWGISPAYDLTPTPHVSAERRDLAMVAGDAGRWANAQNLLSQAPRFLLTNEQATALINDVETKVRERWYTVARRVGVTERDCHTIAGAFSYPGFRLTAQFS